MPPGNLTPHWFWSSRRPIYCITKRTCQGALLGVSRQHMGCLSDYSMDLVVGPGVVGWRSHDAAECGGGAPAGNDRRWAFRSAPWGLRPPGCDCACSLRVSQTSPESRRCVGGRIGRIRWRRRTSPVRASSLVRAVGRNVAWSDAGRMHGRSGSRKCEVSRECFYAAASTREAHWRSPGTAFCRLSWSMVRSKTVRRLCALSRSRALTRLAERHSQRRSPCADAGN